jgi:hypothetical protein
MKSKNLEKRICFLTWVMGVAYIALEVPTLCIKAEKGQIRLAMKVVRVAVPSHYGTTTVHG